MPMDRIVGLELGADDYLPKPFEPRELLARAARHPAPRRAAAGASDVLRFGRLEIDRGARDARARRRARALTGYQFDLLVVLAERAGRVLSRDALMDLVKGEPLDAFDRSIDVHISRSAPRSRTIRSSRAASSPCAARATCSRRRRTETMSRLYLRIHLALLGSLVVFAAHRQRRSARARPPNTGISATRACSRCYSILAVVVGGAAYPIVRYLVRRLERLQQGAEALAAGDLWPASRSRDMTRSRGSRRAPPRRRAHLEQLVGGTGCCSRRLRTSSARR